MLFPVRQLIEGREKPVGVQCNATVQEVLKIMIRNDFSQLPVLQENGSLLGMVSEHSIVKADFHTGGKVNILEMTVEHCLENPKTISPDSDIFEVLDVLQNVYAVIVTENHRPVAILTDYDTTHFFRAFSEGLILVEDIEVSLRGLIENTYQKGDAFQAASKKVFGPPQNNEESPVYRLEDFTFKEIILLISKNWADFAGVLKDRAMFSSVMEPVREIRNQLAHFRGRLDPVQRDTLINARDWLNIRLQSSITATESSKPDLLPADLPRIPPGKGKYAGLQQYLKDNYSTHERISLKFEDVEKIMGSSLPASAHIHRAWWSNEAGSHSHARSWLEAGYKVGNMNMNGKVVTFYRVK